MYTRAVSTMWLVRWSKKVLSVLEGAHLTLKQTEHIYMVLVSIVIGLLGGLGAVGFRESIRLFQEFFWHADNPTLAYLHGLPWWWKVLAPASGGLIVGLIIARFAAEAKGHGVPEVMESVALHGGRIARAPEPADTDSLRARGRSGQSGAIRSGRNPSERAGGDCGAPGTGR